MNSDGNQLLLDSRTTKSTDVSLANIRGEGSDAIRPITTKSMPSTSIACSLTMELLKSIFASFTPHPNYDGIISNKAYKKRNAHLLFASLTCKNFYVPAMSILWQSLDSWIPLIRLIPSVGELREDRLYTTTKIFEKDDLHRFFFYLKFVEHFSFDVDAHRQGFQISPHIFQLLHLHSSSGLLPSLKGIVISKFSTLLAAPEVPYLLDLMIPWQTCSQVTIKGICSSTEALATTILTTARIKSPMLTKITLHGHQSAMILGNVRDLCNLEKIDLDLSAADIRLNPQATVTKLGALKHLRLSGYVYDIYSVFGSMFYDTPRLENLTLSLSSRNEIQGHHPYQMLTQLVDEVTNRKQLRFKSFVINTLDPQIRLRSSHGILNYFGRPSCTQLKKLSLPFDEITHRSLTSLPLEFCHKSLEWLIITGGVPSGSSTKASLPLPAIYSFQKLFPNLKYLEVPFSLRVDSSQIATMKGCIAEDTARPCHGLEELTFLPFLNDASPSKFSFPAEFHPTGNVADLFTISRFVNHMFPHLRDVHLQELYQFVDGAWLNGLEVGVREFQEMFTDQGICRRCRKGTS